MNLTNPEELLTMIYLYGSERYKHGYAIGEDLSYVPSKEGTVQDQWNAIEKILNPPKPYEN